ncbi:MAG: hypothetical protein KGD67_03890 [Candidatus Lokiarchaeota archaeon]|nr:hypothetical protein [Candidatus Lokiarchaeota archaeon]
MSNNSHKKFGIYKAGEIAPDYILKILSVLEDTIRDFKVIVEKQEDSTTIKIQDNKKNVQKEAMRIIYLDVYTKPKSYEMNLYHQTNGVRNKKPIYGIKVKGDYELKTLKNNLEKLIRGKNLTHHPKSYPF